MQFKTRVLIIIAVSLLGLAIMGGAGLYVMRQSLLEERRAQIAQLLDFANAQLQYFQTQEAAGKLTREEAQARAREAISAQKTGGDYFIVRALADNMLLVHATASRVGKIDPGGKAIDGRPVIDVYKEEIGKSRDGKGFVLLEAVRPNSGDKTLYKKLNGATVFPPWGWMIAIGFFVDDIEARFLRQSGAFLLLGGSLLVLVAALVFRMRVIILRQLGGEPHDAAESMKKIASGHLNEEIVLQRDDEVSLMASLKRMQMKLKNMTSAVSEGADALRDQVREFERLSHAHADAQTDDGFWEMMRSAKKLGKTAEAFGRSISRFKM